MCSSFETHTHMWIGNKREKEIYLLGELEPISGFEFVLLIHLYRGRFVGFSSPRKFPRINLCLSCDCVSFNDPSYAMVVKLNWILMIYSLSYGILTWYYK